jgi:nucleoid-associated protein YgaU
MERMGVRLVARALVALCVAACVLAGAPAAHAAGGRTIASAPGIELDAVQRGRLYNGAFYSGFSVAYWARQFAKGDFITILTTASGGDTPPCQMLYMPGTDDGNVDATSPYLEPASQSRDGSRDVQRFTATETGLYVLAMTNADVILSGPLQCLDAPPGRPFTFRVTAVHRGGGDHSDTKGGGSGERGASGASTRVVKPGESLWAIARGFAGERAGTARIVSVVARLWQLNAARIGSGDPNLIYPGQTLIYRRP